MKTAIRRIILLAFVFAFSMTVAGCGGGGGGSSPGSSTKAKTSVKTAGLVPPGMLVGALEVIVSMPYGVTVECIPGTNNPTDNVIQLIGAADTNMLLKGLDYTPATPTSKGSLRVQYFKADGFTPSNSILIQLDITTGFFPKNTDFSLDKFEIATFNPSNGDISGAVNVNDPSLFQAEVI